MSTEELLKPRYKVIADFWNSPFKVGHIIEMTGKSKRFPLMGGNNMENWETWIDTDGGGANCYSIIKFESYPHLFKKLEWWEERGLDFFSQIKYVKWKEIGFFGQRSNLAGCIEKVEKVERMGVIAFKIPSQTNPIRIEYFEPADETEYNDYIKSKHLK